MTIAKPSLFLSYAHLDALRFTERLAFGLSMYADVFWDRRLPTGEWEPVIFREIEAREYFVLIMSPGSLRNDSYCWRELDYAQKHKNDKIGLALIHPDCGRPKEVKELMNMYTCGPFTEDFEIGFRRLTAMMLDQPYSSWEYLNRAVHPKNDQQLIHKGLRRGFVPGVIAKSLAEWVIVDRVWRYIELYIQEKYERDRTTFFRGSPRTPAGVLRECQGLSDQFAEPQRMDGVGVGLINLARGITNIYVQDIFEARDDDHRRIGQATYNIIDSAKTYFESQAIARREAIALWNIREKFIFDTAEKLRELITLHARQSRYLY